MQKTRRSSRKSKLNAFAITALSAYLAIFLVSAELQSSFAGSIDLDQTKSGTASRKYSEFPHNKKAHQKECSSCHKFPTENWNKVRTGDAAFPDVTDYPKHDSCVNCHRQQFFRGANPAICSICHVSPSPRNSIRNPFPNPRETFDRSQKGKNAVSDFAISFPHDKHIDIVSQNERRTRFVTASWSRSKLVSDESCAVCHSTYQPQGDSPDEFMVKPPAKLGDAFWLKKGTFKTSPISHSQCFLCHSTDSGLAPAPADCAVCHRLKEGKLEPDIDPRSPAAATISDKIVMNAWQRRNSSGAFRHEWLSHADLSCSACHNTAALNTADRITKTVSISSCNTCHITATSDEGGALNFEIDSRRSDPKFQCVKCHLMYGSLPIPGSHIKALGASAGK